MKLYYIEENKQFLISFKKQSLRSLGVVKKIKINFSPFKKAMIFENNHSDIFKASKKYYKSIEEVISH
jgi:hypothetical protein